MNEKERKDHVSVKIFPLWMTIIILLFALVGFVAVLISLFKFLF